MSTEQVAAGVVDDEAMEAAYLAEMATPVQPDEQSPEAEGEVEANAEQEGTQEQQSEEAQPADPMSELKEQVAKLQKALDTTNGTYGARLAEQQKVIEQLAQQRQQTIGGMSKDKLKRLSAEFPELAELLAEDLSEIIGSGGSQGFDPEQFEQTLLPKTEALVQERLEKAEQAREIRALTRRHNDWKEVAMYTVAQDGSVAWNNPEFGVYVSSLPADEQEKLVSVFDADFVGDVIAGFKEAKTKSGSGKKQSSSALEAAILPAGTGGGRPAPNPLDDEEAAFRAEMAKG